MTTIDVENIPAISWIGRKKKSVNQRSTETTNSWMVQRRRFMICSRRINDAMSIIAVLGIVLTIIATELRFHGELSNSTSILVLRSVVTASTAVLIGLLFCYHIIIVKVETMSAHLYDWRIVITERRIFLIICEVFVCFIHPFPYYWDVAAIDTMTPDEILLTLPSKIFFLNLRLYLHFI